MIAYRTTITRCLAFTVLVGCSTLSCKGGIYETFKKALARDDTDAVATMIDDGRISIDRPIEPPDEQSWLRRTPLEPPDEQSWLQRTPLHIAAEQGAVKTVEFLLEKGAKTDLTDQGGFTPLHLAAFYQRQEVVAKLMEADQQLATMKDEEEYMALHRAIQNHVPEQSEHVQGQAEADRDRLVRCLLPENLPTDTVHEMVIARVEVPKGEHPEQLLGSGYLAIHLAAKNGTLQAMLHILEQGKEDLLKELCNNDCTLLHLAAENRQSTIAIALLKRKAICQVVHQMDQKGCTFLHYAIACPCTAKKVIKALSKSVLKALLVQEDRQGRIPIHQAIMDGHLEVVKLLPRPILKALLSRPDNDGRTPLHQAVSYGHLEVVKFLVEQGADLNALDNFNYTPLDLASNKSDISDYLRSKKAQSAPRYRWRW